MNLNQEALAGSPVLASPGVPRISLQLEDKAASAQISSESNASEATCAANMCSLHPTRLVHKQLSAWLPGAFESAASEDRNLTLGNATMGQINCSWHPAFPQASVGIMLQAKGETPVKYACIHPIRPCLLGSPYLLLVSLMVWAHYFSPIFFSFYDSLSRFLKPDFTL